MSRFVAVLVALGAALPPAIASAEGDPIMPLDQVQRGMRCTGLSVVRGTEPARFDVEILDVVAGDAGGRAPRILFEVSGEAVDRTGIGPGFSGSPIYCPDREGVQRNAGAISEGVGEYGGKVGLATPIQEVLGEPVDPPAAASPPTASTRSARPLAAPLTFSGVSGPVAKALAAAGRKAGRVVYAAPAAPRQASGTPAPPRPGSAMAVGVASGDVTASSVGTVAYVDGDKVWSFGHPLEAVGRRGLFLQSAFVHTVVNNPVGSQDLSTYKLASPSGDLGTLTNDAPSAVVGRLGALPDRFELSIVARDLDTGRVETTRTSIADETAAGRPAGVSALAQVAPTALAQAAYTILRGTPAEQGGEMCARIVVRERAKPLRFCNRYVGGGGPGAAGTPMVADLVEAIGLFDGFRLGALHPTRVSIKLGLRRGLRQAYLTGVSGPSVVRRGRTYRLRLTARRVRGGIVRRTVRVRIPRSIPRGEQDLTLTGAPADSGGGGDELGEVLTLSLGDEEETDDPGPRTVAELAREIARLGRYDGVTLSFRDPGLSQEELEEQGGVAERRLFRDDDLRFSGVVALPVFVRS